VIAAMGDAAKEVMQEYLDDDDELVRRITESVIAYRDLSADTRPTPITAR